VHVDALEEADMRPGQGSQTAVMVCAGRALAHGRADVGSFSDPTALALLPDAERERVERLRSGAPPRNGRERWQRVSYERRSMMMVARTITIDEAVRAAALDQVVILGAGLDGRAWRMPELAGATVFEVDHPDTQRDKRARVAPLKLCAREVRFVSVDFSRDDLGSALQAAGHDATRPSTWIWEGVVMYLTRPQIEATLEVIARRSAARSQLIVAYHQPALILVLFGFLVRRLGEPLRSAFRAEQMRELLAAYGFRVTRDEDVPTIGARISACVGQQTRRLVHARVAVAVL
jgi:methyltransferase (TIGR00027 family)